MFPARGQVAEWLKASVSKTDIPATVSWVRIPPCPPRAQNFPIVINGMRFFSTPYPSAYPSSTTRQALNPARAPHRRIDRWRYTLGMGLPPSEIDGMGWDGAFGRRYKIYCIHNSKPIKALWLSVGKDQSLYVGPYWPKANFAKVGTVQSKGGEAFFDYSHGEQVTPSANGNAAKISIHSSGAIHALGMRAFRDRFRELTKREELCNFVFSYPQNAEAMTATPGRNDMLVPYVVTGCFPFYAVLSIAPLTDGKPTLTNFAGGTVTKRCFIVFDGPSLASLPEVKPFAIEVAFCQRGSGPWPPATYFVSRAAPDSWINTSISEDGAPE